MKHLSVLIVFISLQLFSQDTISYSAYFNTDAFELDKEQLSSITGILTKLEGEISDYKFEIQGHTDSIGDWSYNLQLSDKRCHSIENEIKKLGVSSSQINLKPHSFNLPADKNSTIKGRANNRRAELSIIYMPEKPVWNLIEQSYVVNPNTVNIITTTNGCKITIPANATAVTSTLNTVEYRITEYNSPAEFIAAGIPMSYRQQSGFYMYHSEELFNIYALNGKDTLKLNKGAAPHINCKSVDTSNTKFYKFNARNKNWVENKVIEKKAEKKIEEKQPKTVEEKKITAEPDHKPEEKTKIVEEKKIEKTETQKDKPGKIGINGYNIDTVKKRLNLIPVKIDTFNSRTLDIFDDYYLINNRSCTEYWDILIRHALTYTLKDFDPYTDTTAEYIEKNFDKRFQYSDYYKSFNYARTRFVDTTDAGTKNNTGLYSLKLNYRKLFLQKKYSVSFKQLKKKENPFFNDFAAYEWNYDPGKNNTDIHLLAKKKFSDFRINYDHATNSAELELKSRNHLYTLILTPKLNRPEQEIFDKKVLRFKDSLVNAEALYKEDQRRRKSLDSLNFKNNLRIAFNTNYLSLYEFWLYSQCAKEEAEKDLKYHQWIRYFNQHRSEIRSKYLGFKERPNALYANCCIAPPKEVLSGTGDPLFLIINFGLYNFDKIISLNSLITLKDHSLISEKGNKLDVDYSFLILKGINGMVNFSSSDDPFLVKGFENILIVYTKQHRCYKFTCNLIKKEFSEQKTMVFKNITKKMLTKKGAEKELNVN